MRLMQRELEDLKEVRQREARQAEEDREELIIFRDRCNKLEEENELRQERVIILLCLHLLMYGD
jgi:FtsZ-binding cell division protein ZapB